MLESKGTPQPFDQVNQTFVPSCFNCQSPTHVMEDCLFLPNPLMNSKEQQLNATYQQQRHDPYAPTYNPWWKNHPNFSWNQGGGYQGGATSVTQPSGSQYAWPNTFTYQQ